MRETFLVSGVSGVGLIVVSGPATDDGLLEGF